MERQVLLAASDGISKIARRVAKTPIGDAIKRTGVVPSNPTYIPYQLASKLRGESVKTISFEGYEIKFLVNDPTERRSVSQHYTPRIGEYSVLQDILSEMNSDDVFVDIGAYIGLQTCLFGQVAARVIPYEPHPTNFRRLSQNIGLNVLDIKPRNMAVSDTAGELEYYIMNTKETDIGGRLRDDPGDPRNSLRVTVTKLSDEIPDHHPVPSILKIDAEGEELSILSDFAEIDDTSACRLIYCEVHPTLLENRDEDEKMVEEKLASMGFTISYFRDVHGDLGGHILKAKR